MTILRLFLGHLPYCYNDVAQKPEEGHEHLAVPELKVFGFHGPSDPPAISHVEVIPTYPSMQGEGRATNEMT